MTAPRVDGLDQIVAESRRRRQGLPPARDALDEIVEESRARRSQQAQQTAIARARTITRPATVTPMDRPVDPGVPQPSRGGGSEWDDGRGFGRNFARYAADASGPAALEYAGGAMQTVADALPQDGIMGVGTAPLRTGLRAAGGALENYGGARRAAPQRVSSIADALDSWDNAGDYLGATLGQGLGSSVPTIVAAATGGLPAAALTAYGQQVGEVGQEFDQVDPQMDRGKRALGALGLAVPLAALDMATEIGAVRGAKRAMAGEVVDLLSERTGREIAGNVAKATAKGALSEGLTEGAQEGGSYFGTRTIAGKPMDIAEGLTRMGEATVAGALPGAVMGGTGQGVQEVAGARQRRGITNADFEVLPGILPKQLPGPVDPDFTVEDNFAPPPSPVAPPPAAGPRKGAVVDTPPAPPTAEVAEPVAPPPPAPVSVERPAVAEPPAPDAPARQEAGVLPVEIEPAAVQERAITPRPPEPPSGRDLTLTFSDGSKTPARWRVAEADALQASHNPFTFQPNPRYPSGVQGRDYANDPSAQQNVQGAALNLDADRLLDPTGSPEMGGPTVTPDGTVVAGNQRTMLVQRARQESPERYAAYVDKLRQNAGRYGLSAADFENVANPVLVREIDGADPATLARLNRLSDTSATKAKSVLDEAASRASSLRQSKSAIEHFAQTMGRDDSVATYLTGKDGKGFVRRLLDDGVIAPQEAARYMDVGSDTLTDEGKLAVRRMLLVSAVGDAATISRAPDSILDKIEGAVPHIIRADLSGDADYKAGPLVKQALDVIAEARDKGVKLADLVDQVDLEGNVVPEPVARMARFLSETRKKADITEVFRQFGQFADESAARQRDGDLFGGAESGLAAAVRLFGAGSVARESGTTPLTQTPRSSPSSKRAPLSTNRSGDPAPASPAAASTLAAKRPTDAVVNERGADRVESVLPGNGGAARADARQDSNADRAGGSDRQPASGSGGVARRTSAEVARENYIRPLAEYTPVAYREMSPEAAVAFVEGGESGDPFFASVPELALGQGSNRGVLIEVDTRGLQGQVHTSKPAWAPAYDSGAFELLGRANLPAQYAEAVRSVTVARSVRPFFARRMDLKLRDGWTKETLPDGRTVYRAPVAAAPATTDADPVPTESPGKEQPLAAPADTLTAAVASLADTVKDLRATVEAMAPSARAAAASSTAQASPVAPAEGEPTGDDDTADEGASTEDTPLGAPAFADTPSFSADDNATAPAARLQQEIAGRATDGSDRARALGTVFGGAVGGAFGGPFGAVWGAVTGYGAVRSAQRALGAAQKLRAKSEPLRALIDINRTLAASVGVPLRQGRGNLAAMRALGWYMPTTDAIRVKRFGDVRTGAHEVGHYLSNRYLNTSPQSRKAGTQVKFPKPVRDELLAAGHALYGSRKPNGGYLEEGIAEFFRFWVTDPDKMASTMPNARAFFDGLLLHEPTVRAALDHAQTDYLRFVKAPAHARVAAMLSVNEGRWAMPSFPALWGNLKRSWLDDLHDIRETVEALQSVKPVPPSRDAYLLARLSRGVAGEAEQAIETGIRKRDGTALTNGIRDALRSIPNDRLSAFVEYVVAERAIEKANQGINTGVDLDAARSIQQEYVADPVFQQAAEALWAHSSALIELRVEGGLLTKEQAKAILDRNQKRVPFQREFSEDEKARGLSGSGRAPARNSSGIQRMMGSDRRIIDPLESILRETHDAYRQVRQHQAIQALVEHAQAAPGGARFVEVLREAPKDITSISGNKALNEVLDRLTDLGILDATEASGDIAALSDADRDTLYAALVDFRERSQASGREKKDLVLPMLINGERQWVQVKDAALYEALLGMNREETRGWVQIAAVGSRLLRAGATLTTEFIARNPGRDALSAFVRTRGGWALPFEHLARGLFHLAKKDALYESWRREGGDNAAQLSLDRTKNQDALAALRRTLGERVLVAMTPGNWLDTLRAVSAVSENATRLGEFDLVMRKQREAGASEADALAAAALASRDVTVDFAKAGTAGRAFNQIVAFFNANVQDLSNMAEDLNVRRDPKRAAEVAAKAALLALPTMLLWLSQKDDDDYKEIPQDIRDRNYVYIHKAIGPDGKEDRLKSAVFTFPKAYGIAGLASLLAERVAEYLDTKDPDALKAIRKTLVGSYVPSVMPTAALPLVEVYANRDRFRDRPIVSQGLERLLPEDQATDRTGETARVLGQAAGYSPALLEHLIVGYTAGLGRSSLEAVDWLVRGVRDKAGLDPLRKILPMEQVGAFGAPVAKAFWRPLPAGNAQSVTEVYGEMEKAEQAATSYARLRKQGSDRAEMLLASRGGEVASATSSGGRAVTKTIRARLDKLNEERRSVMQSDAPPELRRQRLRVIDDERIQVARLGLSLLQQKAGARVAELPDE